MARKIISDFRPMAAVGVGGYSVDYYKQALKFEVVSNITDVGVTRIPHKWELHI